MPSGTWWRSAGRLTIRTGRLRHSALVLKGWPGLGNHENSRCLILTPVGHYIEPHCDLSLRQLEARGYEVLRWYGASQIDVIRNRLATKALADGFTELMWIDADMAFDPGSVDRLRAHDLPIVCGLYPTKVECRPTWVVRPGAPEPPFGPGGGLMELHYAPTGFLYTRSEVYREVQRREDLPVCNRDIQQELVPFFLPMVVPTGDAFRYLGEDYAFCERARRCGYRIFADTTIRLQHIGMFGYSV